MEMIINKFILFYIFCIRFKCYIIQINSNFVFGWTKANNNFDVKKKKPVTLIDVILCYSKWNKNKNLQI